MNLAKGKILYPLPIKSCKIYDEDFTFKSYNNLTWPFIFLETFSSLAIILGVFHTHSLCSDKVL